MRLKHILLYSATVQIRPSIAFASPQQRRKPNPSTNIQRDILSIRGGDIGSSSMASTTTTMASALSSAAIVAPLRRALVSGSSIQAIGALYAICSLVVVPLTWYRTAYSFSVGYGLSIAAASLALLSSFTFSGGGTIGISQLMTAKGAPTILSCTALVYGLRLAAFIYVREHTVEEKRRVFEDMDRKPPLQRTPLALGVSMLYAFMVSPALFAFRGTLADGSVSERLQVFFTGVAAFGMLLESIADQHKYEVKRQCPKGGKFVGPTTWTYKLCRHPNYLGEILHWAGIFGAGCVSFGTSIVAWVGGVLGLAGILSIMLGSSASLDKRQLDKYGGQIVYDEWKEKVTSSVIPFIK